MKVLGNGLFIQKGIVVNEKEEAFERASRELEATYADTYCQFVPTGTPNSVKVEMLLANTPTSIRLEFPQVLEDRVRQPSAEKVEYMARRAGELARKAGCKEPVLISVDQGLFEWLISWAA